MLLEILIFHIYWIMHFFSKSVSKQCICFDIFYLKIHKKCSNKSYPEKLAISIPNPSPYNVQPQSEWELRKKSDNLIWKHHQSHTPFTHEALLSGWKRCRKKATTTERARHSIHPLYPIRGHLEIGSIFTPNMCFFFLYPARQLCFVLLSRMLLQIFGGG